MTDKTTKTKKRRTLSGVVVKLSSANTVKVRVEVTRKHTKYDKIVTNHVNYLVDYKGDDVVVGEKVTIAETKPMSKNKAWELIAKIK